MKFFAFALIAAAVLCGCTPKLANRELNPEEKEWKEYLEDMYPGWKFPGTLPPAVSDRTGKTPLAADKQNDGTDSLQVVADKDVLNSDNADDSLAGDTAESEKNKVRYEEYTVEKDDSLSLIAKKVYGNGRKYYRIYKANEDIIKNKNKIYPGMKLRIPRP